MPGVLFVTRKFPPSVGGMETLAADVWATLRAGSARPRVIAHGGSLLGLPWFMLRAVVGTVALVVGRRCDVVLTGDVVMYLLLGPVLRILRVRHATMAMGKDVVWERYLYQQAVRTCLHRAPLVLAISSATADAVRAAGVVPERVRVVRLGIDPPGDGMDRRDARASVISRYGLPDDAVLLLTLGRLVRRKGVAWFIAEVLPHMPGRAHYLVAGSGPDWSRIDEAVRTTGMAGRVTLLGRVGKDDRELLMHGADVFVQPNTPVPGDMEGFGLVAVEAAMRGSCVVAADLEGLRDAVADGETGILVAPEDALAWIATLTHLVDDPAEARRAGQRFSAACRRAYDRDVMGHELARLLGIDDASA